MSSQECRLEINAVLLLIPFKNVEILDIAYAKATCNTDDGIVLTRLLACLVKQVIDLHFESLLFVDDDIRAGVCIPFQIDIDCLPSVSSKVGDHGTTKGTVASKNETFTSLLHLLIFVTL